MTRGRRAYRGSATRFERFLLSIMGPAHIGENKPPDGYVPDPAAELCRRCSRPWVEHERLHKDNIAYLRCPEVATDVG